MVDLPSDYIESNKDYVDNLMSEIITMGLLSENEVNQMSYEEQVIWLEVNGYLEGGNLK